MWLDNYKAETYILGTNKIRGGFKALKKLSILNFSQTEAPIFQLV